MTHFDPLIDIYSMNVFLQSSRSPSQRCRRSTGWRRVILRRSPSSSRQTRRRPRGSGSWPESRLRSKLAPKASTRTSRPPTSSKLRYLRHSFQLVIMIMRQKNCCTLYVVGHFFQSLSSLYFGNRASVQKQVFIQLILLSVGLMGVESLSWRNPRSGTSFLCMPCSGSQSKEVLSLLAEPSSTSPLPLSAGERVRVHTGNQQGHEGDGGQDQHAHDQEPPGRDRVQLQAGAWRQAAGR